MMEYLAYILSENKTNRQVISNNERGGKMKCRIRTMPLQILVR